MAESRPRPLLEALTSGAWKTALGGAISLVGELGVITANQETTLNTALAALLSVVALVPGAVGVVTHLWQAFRTGEAAVTPTSDPRADDGTPLVVAPLAPPAVRSDAPNAPSTEPVVVPTIEPVTDPTGPAIPIPAA